MHCCDALSLEIRSVDGLKPHVVEVQAALKNYPKLPPNYEPLNTVNNWTDKLSGMKATDEITEDEARQMLLDLQTAMNRFKEDLTKM